MFGKVSDSSGKRRVKSIPYSSPALILAFGRILASFSLLSFVFCFELSGRTNKDPISLHYWLNTKGRRNNNRSIKKQVNSLI